MGFFKQLKEAWLASVTFDKLDDEFYDQLEEALILADVGVDSATDAVEKLRKKVKERLLTRADEVKDALRAILAEKLEVGDASLNLSTTPSIVLFIGVNGVGKTTSIGKLAAQLKAEGKKVLLCAGDTFRAAAADQLEIWADRAGVDIIRQNEGADPGSVLFDALQAAKARGVKVYHLNIGQPDLPSPQTGLAALKKIDRKVLEYSPSDGYRSLREKLAGYYQQYQIKLSPEEIIVTTGGSEAVLFAFMSCLNPGDEIIVPEPAYANYMAFAISAGAVIRPVVSSIEQGFALPDVAEFEKLINERTRGILICNPNNPTGYLYTRREMNRIRDMVKKYDLFLFSDEVYREFIYTGSPYISACHLEGVEQNVVLIDSVSKRYSECGIRIGALITKNKKLRDAVMKFCQARLSPPLIGQIVAEASIDAPRSYSTEVYEEYIERRKCLIDGLNRIPGVYSPIPMGAFYTVARLPVEDSDDFCAWCLSDFEYEGETVMLAPASGFYSDPTRGRNEVRIAYVLKKEDLERSLLILGKALEAYNNRK